MGVILLLTFGGMCGTIITKNVIEGVLMSKILLSSNKKQYKANLHCHSIRSDGKLTPEELKAHYKANGYDIRAITDHCNPKDHSALNDEEFMLLTGYEAYIRPSEEGRYNAFAPEVHLNLFAKEPTNEKLVCYNEKYTKYVPKEEHSSLCRVGTEEPRKYTTEYVNQFIKTAKENGYLVAYNHPVWSMETEERILSYEGLFSLEMYNTSSYVGNNLESGEQIYDIMMRHGWRIGCHAGDDNHNGSPIGSPYDDSCGWYTVILADELEYGSVIEALENREFYASNGPRFKEISISDTEEGKRVHVECTPASKAFMYYGSKAPKHIRLPDGETNTSFDFVVHPKAEYVRVSVYDEKGNVANSRGFFRDEWDV